MIAYTITFSFFGGLAVFFYPNDVFIETIGINIQTMIHHGTQILLGVFLFTRYRKVFDFKFYVKSIFVFFVMLLIATVLDIAVYKHLVSIGNTETFNMFFISPYFDCTLPILSIIYDNVPYIVFYLIYMLGFVLISYIIFIVVSIFLYP